MGDLFSILNTENQFIYLIIHIVTGFSFILFLTPVNTSTAFNKEDIFKAKSHVDLQNFVLYNY